MASQITFFRKSLCDFENQDVVVTASQGQASAPNVFARSNRVAWGTSGSVDADNTTFLVNFNDVNTIDTLLLIQHNFASFKVEWWDDVGLVWNTLENVSGVAATTSYFRFSTINTSMLRLTVFGTQVPNSDKVLSQFIATTFIGQLAGWPVITKPTIGRNIITQDMLSGKQSTLLNVGFYSATLTVTNWRSASDLAIVEAIFNSSEGFLYWPSGGDQAQFSSVRQGYRLQDIYLVRCQNEYTPEWAYGLYQTGMKMQINLAEVVT